MLLSVAIPSFTGYSAPDRNVGKMHTRGWEVKLGWSDRIGDVSYAVSFNISDYKSIIDNLNGKQQFNSDGTIITEGAEYNSWYGDKTAGLFQTAVLYPYQEIRLQVCSRPQRKSVKALCFRLLPNRVM